MEHDLGSVSQIPLGEGRNFLIADVCVAVFRPRTGGVYATQPLCPHRLGPLADGLIEGTSIVCPLHDRVFNLATGEGIGVADGISVYPVRVDGDGNIMISVSQSVVS